MNKVVRASRRFSPSSCIDDDGASHSPQSAVRARPPVPQLLLKTSSVHNICTMLIFAMTYFKAISAQQAVANFSVRSTEYSCDLNLFCEAGAYVYPYSTRRIEAGRLSLTPETTSALHTEGVAYYRWPVRLLDRTTNQSASFSTSFTFDVTTPDGQTIGGSGDGMTFLLSANRSYYGYPGQWLGIFDMQTFSTPFKSIVVEFDTYYNPGFPTNDINDNHVSFDFTNVTGMAPVDTANVRLADAETKYAWVDYSNQTRQLEVRVSYNNTKPLNSLSSYKVSLFDIVEEYMWVGFSSASGLSFGNFYIGNWTFESYGVTLPSPVPAESSGVPLARPVTAKSTGSKVGIIVGIVLGVLAFLLASTVAIALLVRVRRFGVRDKLGGEETASEDYLILLKGMPERFSYKDLSVATKAFSEEMKLGQGGFGSVYRGMLSSSGSAVAVKKIKSDSNQGEREFMAEISIISRLRHRNLIQLQGWCNDAAKDKFLLVYELMPNGSLDKILFGPSDSQSTLSWAQRLNILTGTAAALDYLHLGWKQQVIHRDVKSSNIMLDEEWNAKLGDFGLARLVDHQRAASTTIVAGTYGYIAPEAAATGHFTDKTDVFAFGAVVLEIACGRRAFSTDFPAEERSLVDWVWRSLSEAVLLSTVDKRLVDYDIYWMNVILIVGLWCSHPNPLARPSMRHVVQVLAGDAPVPSIPASKPNTIFSADPLNISIDSLLDGRFMWGSFSSRSTSVSLVSMSNSDSTQASTLKSLDSSLNSNS